MSMDRLPPTSTHRLCLSGLRKQYLAHLVLFATFFLLGVSFIALGIIKPKSGTLLPGALMAAASFVPLTPVIVALSTGMRRVDVTADGFVTRVWQHEFDHLNGTLLTDRMGAVARMAARRTLKDLEDRYRDEHGEGKKGK